MKKRLKPLLIVLAALGAALAALLLSLLGFTGQLTPLQTGFVGVCDTVPLAGSAQDLQLDRERGVAYLSLLDRSGSARGAAQENAAAIETGRGTIMLLDLNLTEPSPRAAMAYDPPDFRPHGISLLQRQGQATRLFAISQQAGGAQTVEVAEQGSGGAFFPAETIRHQDFSRLNSIAAIGPRQFYLVNDLRADNRLGRATDLLLRQARATLIYFDGTEARVAAIGLEFPSGIALSPDSTRLYVGEMLARRLLVYRRDLATGELAPEETVPLAAAPANLNVDAQGVVWIASHPKLLSFFAHAHEPARRAPTQVLRFDPRGAPPAEGEPDTRLTQVYLNSGEQLSAGTVAAAWRDRFLIGALLDHKVLICKPTP